MKTAVQTAALIIGSMLLGAGITVLALPGTTTLKGESTRITCYRADQITLRETTELPVRINARGHVDFRTDTAERVVVTAPCVVRTTGEN